MLSRTKSKTPRKNSYNCLSLELVERFFNCIALYKRINISIILHEITFYYYFKIVHLNKSMTGHNKYLLFIYFIFFLCFPPFLSPLHLPSASGPYAPDLLRRSYIFQLPMQIRSIYIIYITSYIL